MTEYATLVLKLGQRYGRERRAHPDIDYPSFSGTLEALGVDALRLPRVQGEYMIAWTDADTSHTLAVYIECGVYTVQGRPGLGAWGMQAAAGQG